ncbi:MAG: hypothetical protein ACFBWO_02900 [Paracoccaceae bacterium]
MRRLFRATLLAAAFTAGAAVAGAAPDRPLDWLFSTPHLEGLGAGVTLHYAHSREAAPATRLGSDFTHRVELSTGEAGQDGAVPVFVTMDADGRARRLDTFRGVPGNPMLMVFLEAVVDAVSRATGGSPFYLRNRMREALRDDLASQPMILQVGSARLPARALSVRPFEGDKNAAALGPFEAMSLRFVVAEEAPGMLVAMTAATEATLGEGDEARPVYIEEIRLDPTR